jgi:hypothetical protein
MIIIQTLDKGRASHDRAAIPRASWLSRASSRILGLARGRQIPAFSGQPRRAKFKGSMADSS